jgi:hypothetical protein
MQGKGERIVHRGLLQGMVVTLALAALMLGCASEPSGLDKLPSLAQIASRHPHPVDAPSPNGAKPSTRIEVRELALPIQLATDKAWQQVIDQSVFPELTREAWQANGMRIGVLARSDLAKLTEALPPVMSHRTSVLYASSQPSELLKAPGQAGPIRADLSMLTDGGSKPRRLRGGRMQILARTRTDSAGNLFLHLIPHHHKRKLTLKPRDPSEKKLDGTVFENLALRMPAPRNQIIVVGLHRLPKKTNDQPPGYAIEQPPNGEGGSNAQHASQAQNNPNTRPAEKPGNDPQEESTKKDDSTTGQDSSTGDDAPTGEDDGPKRIENPLDIRPHMGRALFAGRRLGRPRQWLVLIHVQKLE